MNRSWSVRSFASICALLFWMVAVSATAQPVASLALNPSTITGGTGGISIGTVTIGAAAGTSGQVITLTSSNTDLAASTPRIVIPAGATSATFIVGTNADYRRYSGLAFTATITARSASDGSSASALLIDRAAIPDL